MQRSEHWSAEGHLNPERHPLPCSGYQAMDGEPAEAEAAPEAEVAPAEGAAPAEAAPAAEAAEAKGLKCTSTTIRSSRSRNIIAVVLVVVVRGKWYVRTRTGVGVGVGASVGIEAGLEVGSCWCCYLWSWCDVFARYKSAALS